MNLFMRFLGNLGKYGLEYFGRYYSEYDGTCVDNKDPGEQGRVKVVVPSVGGNKPLGAWAWPKPLWGGKNSGTFFVPDVGDKVLVTFMNGHPSYPRYGGNAWPNQDGSTNFTPTGMYVDGVPVVRGFRTKAGHELSFCDDPKNNNIKIIWHDPEKDLWTFFSITKEGGVQMGNHKGAVFEMRASDDDKDLNLIMDSRGNMISQDKSGMKMVDFNGNVVEMKKGVLQVISSGDVIVTGDKVNFKISSAVIGDGASQPAVRGQAWFDWFNNTFLQHYLAHTHPTGVGPSAAYTAPLTPPVDKDILTQNVTVP